MLVMNANLVEENHYIDGQVFESGSLTLRNIQAADIMTPDEIKLRRTAIKALCDYTTALATLASGKPAESIGADAQTASGSLNTLATDLGKALKAPSRATTKIAGPISSAVAGAGEVIALIEKRRGRG